ncbi:MAG: TIGR04282 family arsenosugar biosynthesis glycosyltransferase [Cyclobacteriaceae bacterium]|nr:TIGR04282 family arsenosugar biosynthesis glycosyltransferase [Cyclobacteriaceae bacterium]
MQNSIIVFARKPLLGKVKTRLAAEIGDENALKEYTSLLTNTIAVSRKANATQRIYWSESENKTELVQKGNDLGERMFNALTEELKVHKKACLVGTDVPLLTAEIINQAFEALNTCDIVFGPSTDGGYYLVALKNFVPKELFLNKTWSHPSVLKEALAICKELDLRTYLTPTLLDIDTKKDLENWKNQT